MLIYRKSCYLNCKQTSTAEIHLLLQGYVPVSSTVYVTMDKREHDINSDRWQRDISLETKMSFCNFLRCPHSVIRPTSWLSHWTISVGTKNRKQFTIFNRTAVFTVRYAMNCRVGLCMCFVQRRISRKWGEGAVIQSWGFGKGRWNVLFRAIQAKLTMTRDTHLMQQFIYYYK